MIELAPNIFYITGKNNSRFPYCACLYLRGKKLRVLIDAGMGTENLAPAKEMGIDLSDALRNTSAKKLLNLILERQ